MERKTATEIYRSIFPNFGQVNPNANPWLLFQKAFVAQTKAENKPEARDLSTVKRTKTMLFNRLAEMTGEEYKRRRSDGTLWEYIDEWTNPNRFSFVNKLTELIKQARADIKQQGLKLSDKYLNEGTNMDVDESSDVHHMVDAMVDAIAKQMDINKNVIVEVISPILYKDVTNAMVKKELVETAPMIILQPGSRWVKEGAESYSQFKPTSKQIYTEVLRDVTKGKSRRQQAWKSLCSQMGELGKEELIQLAGEMDLQEHIKSSMTKKQICDLLQKYAQTASDF